MAIRNNTFILKRSNIVNKIPVLSGLTLGELALNTADAKLYSLYTGGLTGATEVRQIGWDRLSVSGGTLYGNLDILGSATAQSISNLNFINFTTGSTVTGTTVGTVYFDNTEKALSYNTSINQGVTVNLGQQNYIRVFNSSGTDIQRGKALEILTASNGLPAVTLAVNRLIGSNIIGVSSEIIPNNSEGIAITNGIISNIPLTGVSIGSLIYASDTVPGDLDSATKYLDFPLTARTNEIGYVVQTGLTDGKLFVHINNENNVLSLTDLQRNVLEGNGISTGVFEFSGIFLSTGNTFNVGPVQGFIIDNTSDPLKPNATYVKYLGQSGLTTPYLTTDTETYVLLTSGGTISLQATFPTPQQRRISIYLGKIGHGSKTSLINAFNEPDLDISPLSQLRDMFTPIKLINDGVVTSPNGPNLNFNTSAGILWGLGINFIGDVLNPGSLTIVGSSPTTFQYRTQTGGTATNTTLIDPLNYDLNGVITPIGSPAKQSTNQRIFLLQNGQIRLQYGQKKYTDLTSAIAGAQTETFVKFSNFRDNAILIGLLSVASDATDLSNTTQALFQFVSKFGELGGGTAGISTTTLQQAYNNSSSPEIVTNSTLNGLQFRDGTNNLSAKNIIVEDFVGNQTAWVTAGGLGVFNSVSATTITASTYNISTLPTENSNLNQMLGRNSTSGLVERRDVNTIGNNYTYVSGSTYSATTSDNVIGVDSSISATTIYLPNSVSSGRLRYDIKDIGLNSYNNNITIISQGSDTIISTENSNTVILASDGGALIIFNTSTGNWLQM